LPSRGYRITITAVNVKDDWEKKKKERKKW